MKGIGGLHADMTSRATTRPKERHQTSGVFGVGDQIFTMYIEQQHVTAFNAKYSTNIRETSRF